MKQAHLERVATRKEAIAAVEKDLRAFGDDADQHGDDRDGEKGEDAIQVTRATIEVAPFGLYSCSE